MFNEKGVLICKICKGTVKPETGECDWCGDEIAGDSVETNRSRRYIATLYVSQKKKSLGISENPFKGYADYTEDEKRKLLVHLAKTVGFEFNETLPMEDLYDALIYSDYYGQCQYCNGILSKEVDTCICCGKLDAKYWLIALDINNTNNKNANFMKTDVWYFDQTNQQDSESVKRQSLVKAGDYIAVKSLTENETELSKICAVGEVEHVETTHLYLDWKNRNLNKTASLGHNNEAILGPYTQKDKVVKEIFATN